MVSLRPVDNDDRDKMLAWRNSPEVARFMYTDHTITPEEHRRWFSRVLQDPRCRYWIIQWRHQDVGVAHLCDIDMLHRRCSWGFYLADPAVRGKGVGSLAEYQLLCYTFDQLQLNKVSCEVLAFNTGMLALQEKFGFRREGYLRQYVHKGGQYHDVVVLSMLRDEWEQLKPMLKQRILRLQSSL